MLLDRALLWLHEQEVLQLGKGLTVFRPAMTIHVKPGREGFTQKDFTPLEEHYAEQTLQTHVMAAYAETGLAEMDKALRLSEDYFVLDREAFAKRWLPGRGPEIRRQTIGTSWRTIVEALGNPTQKKIVTDDREATNVLVLAGPGSGKTRVLVHRIAYLILVKREDPRSILVLSYNRHAAAEIRARLRHLVQEDANLVTVSTCHALAMRLVGASFAGGGAQDFDRVVMQAVSLLNGDGLTRPEAEAQRDTLIQGYRWILVDEYQDIGPEEYALIAAVAGRSLEDPDLRLSLFAVGDDDLNIYGFAGASVQFIRAFEADYKAKPEFLVENYRSTAAIIQAANEVITEAPDRMKAARDLNDKAAPAADLVEWFAEWGRNVRGDQRGLLLLTAHRAKGLEFEDVVILDGTWARLSRDEDGAAPRRLFYVAMTRARRSLALISMGQHPFLPASALRRKVTSDPRLAPPPVTWAMPDMKALDLSWVGRQWNGHDCHKALAEAQIGAPLTLRPEAERWQILDAKGRQLGVMRKGWSPPPGQAILSATLGAVVIWREVDNEEAFRPHLKHQTWEVALPEICFR